MGAMGAMGAIGVLLPSRTDKNFQLNDALPSICATGIPRWTHWRLRRELWKETLQDPCRPSRRFQFKLPEIPVKLLGCVVEILGFMRPKLCYEPALEF